MKFNRLEHFRKDANKMQQYRKALAILYALGIDSLLNELSSANIRPVSPDHPRLFELNALQNQKAIGYMECLENLFSLDSIVIPEDKLGSPDFGARDKMVEAGIINEEEADDIFN